MELYQLKTLKTLLAELKTKPRKSLSQNFLIDGNIVHKIIEAAQILPGETILEIGPGPGVLTEALLKQGAHVIAIEKDNCLSAALSSWRNPSLTLINQDFLKTDLEALLPPKVKVVANIPYHITGILLQRLLPLEKSISSLTLMVQKEVADRILAPVGSSSYSSFTIFTAHHAHAKLLFSVPSSCFYPQPKVSSAVIQLTLKESAEAYPSPLIRTAFQQRRKMLRSSLRSLYPPDQIEAALEKLNLQRTARPQELSLECFKELHRLLEADE